MRIVGSFFQGTRELTSKEKVLTPKDMQGKKYRGVPVKLWSSMLTGMGAVATPVEVSELATALATGLVVGQENPLPNIYNLKLYEVQKYVMMTNHMQSVLSVFVNEKVWQSIPAADRKIMEDTMAEVGKKTMMKDGHLVGDHVGELEVVGDHDGGVADARAQGRDQLGDQARVGGIEARRRLVEEDDLRLHDEGARDAHPPAHAPGQLGGQELVGARHAHQSEKAVHAVGDLAQGHAGVLAERIGDVLVDGHRIEQRGALEDHAHFLAHLQRFLEGERRDVLAFD